MLTKPRQLILALTALLSCLLGAILFLEKRDATEAQQQVLLDSDTVTRIAIASNSGNTRLEKRNSGWWMTTPVEQRANADRIGPLLSMLQLPERQNYALDSIDPVELGLAPPLASVTLDDVVFRFGHLTLDEASRYVQVDERIYLYNEFLYPLLSAGHSALLASQ